jgi:hypothetical protein
VPADRCRGDLGGVLIPTLLDGFVLIALRAFSRER